MSLNWEKGPVIYRSTDDMLVQSFVGTVSALPDGGWRFWYSKASAKRKKYLFGYVELSADYAVVRDIPMVISETPVKEGLAILGVPDHWNLIQPVYIQLPDGRHRLYFWAHGSEGICRFLAADSTDGINYRVEDWRRPCLYHPNDRAISRADLKHSSLTIYCHAAHREPVPDEPQAREDMLMNDATNVYLREDGLFELYSAEVIERPNDGVASRMKDVVIRQIQRRTSSDGLHWSPPETVLHRDDNDPYDIQFYYLAANHLNNGTQIAWLGRYLSDSGFMDLELAFSTDGRQWKRSRKADFARSAGESCIYAPHAMVRKNGLYYLFFTVYNTSHHAELNPQSTVDHPASWIGLATIPCNDLEEYCRKLQE